MEDKSLSQPEVKPFSVLEKFRQLKKEQVDAPESAESLGTSSKTVFQASTSSPHSVNERSDKGRPRWKRSFEGNAGERPCKRVAAELHQGQTEQDVNITEFIRDGVGFDVILKHRYTDFHVNEIDTEGIVVKLTSTEIPEEKEETLVLTEDPLILKPEDWAALKEIVEQKLTSSVDIDVTEFGKEHRQQIHKAVKKRFGVHVYSNTKDIEGKKVMQIGCANGQNLNNKRHCNWPQGRPEYLHFVLYKENSDMIEAVNVLSRITHIKSPKFQYAGTKDKRAVTTQRMCVRRGNVERFRNCINLRAITIGNFSYKWDNLRLGDLNGNLFKIALRNVKASNEVIEEAVESLKQKGFINYFGLQRFGQSALVPTYFIGKAILKGDWKLAVELILKPRPGESCYLDVKEAREIWWNTKCANDALKALTRKDKSIEGKILLALRKHGPNAYQNAFDSLPRQIVTMYLHSYQSLIWNKVVSRRIKEFGLKVLPGDLVKVKADDPQRKTKEEDVGTDDEDSDREEIVDGYKSRIQVRALSSEEAESASIYDVLYPLPGDDIRLPDNQVASWYTEQLGSDGYTMNCFNHVNRKYGMHGSYRTMLERVGDLRWRTVQYSDPDEDLLLSDLDLLKGKEPPKPDPEGPYKAVIVEFILNVCCYATMAIRELTKCETSTSNQASLTNEAKKENELTRRRKLEEEKQEDISMEIESVSENTDIIIDKTCVIEDKLDEQQNHNGCDGEVGQAVIQTGKDPEGLV